MFIKKIHHIINIGKFENPFIENIQIRNTIIIDIFKDIGLKGIDHFLQINIIQNQILKENIFREIDVNGTLWFFVKYNQCFNQIENRGFSRGWMKVCNSDVFKNSIDREILKNILILFGIVVVSCNH